MTQDPCPWLCSAGAANQDVLHFAVKTSTPLTGILGKVFSLRGSVPALPASQGCGKDEVYGSA